MLFKEFKENNLFKNIEEFVINKKVNIRGKEILLLSFIKYGESGKLWTLQKKSSEREEYECYYNTNREEQINHIKRNADLEHIYINKMILQNKEINFTSSQGLSIEYAGAMDLSVINYFIDKGLINEEWDFVDIEDMIFSVYEQSEEEDFPTIDKNKKIDITLHIEEDTIEKLIQHPFKLKIGKYEKDTKINYIDYDGKDNFFYVDELLKYDILEKTISDINANIDQIEKEYRDSYKEDCLLGVEGICPKNMDYTALYYENEENIQLRFLTKEYLDNKPVYSNCTSAMLWYCDVENGINGYNQWVDGIKAVEKDFNGEIEIELFSKFIKIPKEIITLKL